MKFKVLYILILLIQSSFCMHLFAQNDFPCYNGKIDPDAEARASAYRIRNQSRLASPKYFIRVYFHVFNNDDGSNTAATPSQIASEFDSLLAIYSSSNICFIKVGVEYINNTSINTTFNPKVDTTGSVFVNYKTPYCLNIFYVSQILGANSSCQCGIGGTAMSIPSNYCIISRTNIGFQNTIAHEVGHCIGLLHTFETRGGTSIEKISGSNSSTAGDMVTDTKADPYSFKGNSCFVSSSACNYSGTCADPDGATNYNPPFTNLMAYWGCGNARITTVGQMERCYSFLASVPLLQPFLSATTPYVISSTNISTGFNILSASSISTSGTNTITSSAQSVIGANRVVISPGFRATPTSGYTRIISTDCQ